MKHPWQLGPQQMWVWVVTSYLGLGFFNFPRILYENASSSAFYALLAGLAASFVSIQLNAMAAARIPGGSLAHLAKAALGKWGGIAFEMWPFTYQLMVMMAGFRMVADIIHTVNLQRTPPAALIITIAVVVIYVAWHGIEAVTRMFQLWVPVIVILIIGSTVLSVLNYDPVVAMPHFMGWNALWQGFLHHYFIYGGVASISMVLAYTDVRRALPWLHTGLAINSVLLLVAFASVATTVGPFVARDTEWPVISALRLVDVPGFLVVERVGWLVLLGYTMFTVLFLTGLTVVLSVGVTHLFDLPDEQCRYFIAPLVLLAAVIAMFMPDRPTVDQWETGILSYGAIYIALVKPLFLYIVARIRGIGPKQGTRSSARTD
ncbi:MAG TPA: GerAB/ArcD/ProY family transporter [Symbiobacteriaceae bacterium]|jgi:hypothetical protein